MCCNGTEHTNLVNTTFTLNGVEVIRGMCSQNARDPNAPEFGKWKKIEQHSWLGYGTNIDKARPTNFGRNSQNTVRKRLTRADF